ncbi:MAG: hypothetical protein CME33_01200 [Gimesia sp.]|nr:hypothetical protein [Gimesia sp.]
MNIRVKNFKVLKLIFLILTENLKSFFISNTAIHCITRRTIWLNQFRSEKITAVSTSPLLD